MQWEYRVIRVDWLGHEWLNVKFDGPAVEAQLNTLGDQGWELVSASNATQAGLALAVLKRPKGKG